MIIFNLIPATPLDGYKIVNDILGNFYEDTFRYDLLKYLNLLSIVLVIIVSIFSRSGALFLICIMLICKYVEERKIIKQKILINEILLVNYFKF